MEINRKKELLLHFLVNFALKNFFKKKLTESEIKNLFNIFVADKLQHVAERLFVSEKTIKMHRRNIHLAMKEEYLCKDRKLTEEILHHSIFQSCINLISEKTFLQIEKSLNPKEKTIEDLNTEDLATNLPLGSSIAKQL